MLTIARNIMKNPIKSNSLLEGILSGVIAAYMSIVLYLTVFDSLKFAIVIIPVFLIFLFICKILCKAFREYTIQYNAKPQARNRKIWLILFGAIFLGQLLYWLAYYPGGFNLDAYGQWDQVHGYIALNNWHPVFTTAIYWLITRIVDSLGFCIFVQILVFSISVACLLYELYKAGINNKISIALAIVIGFNPSIGMNNVCLYKDVIFAIECIWMTFCLIRIYRTNGQWVKSCRNSICLALIMVAMVLTRHNGIFLVFPLMACLLVAYRKFIRRVIIVIIVTCICTIAIEGPIYGYIGVESHSNVIGEIVGIPMALLVNAYIYDADNIPVDAKDFLEEIADRESWEACYYVGEWDSCKWEFGGTELLQDADLNQILSYTWKTLIACPQTSYQSIRENTRVVWQVVGYSYWNTWIYIEENDYGITENPVSFFSEITDVLLSGSNTLVGTLFVWNIGFWTICALLMLLFVVARGEYKKILFILPILAYAFLTMLLLCGPSHRYFYFIHVLAIPVLIIGAWVKEDSISNVEITTDAGKDED